MTRITGLRGAAAGCANQQIAPNTDTVTWVYLRCGGTCQWCVKSIIQTGFWTYLEEEKKPVHLKHNWLILRLNRAYSYMIVAFYFPEIESNFLRLLTSLDLGATLCSMHHIPRQQPMPLRDTGVWYSTLKCHLFGNHWLAFTPPCNPCALFACTGLYNAGVGFGGLAIVLMAIVTLVCIASVVISRRRRQLGGFLLCSAFLPLLPGASVYIFPLCLHPVLYWVPYHHRYRVWEVQEHGVPLTIYWYHGQPIIQCEFNQVQWCYQGYGILIKKWWASARFAPAQHRVMPKPVTTNYLCVSKTFKKNKLNWLRENYYW